MPQRKRRSRPSTVPTPQARAAHLRAAVRRATSTDRPSLRSARDRRRRWQRFLRASWCPERAHACARLKNMSTSATPAMRQYLDVKQQHRDALVLFRMGDFYEMFYEDALLAARTLDLTLTSRSRDTQGNGIPMCGVPFHAADT